MISQAALVLAFLTGLPTIVSAQSSCSASCSDGSSCKIKQPKAPDAPPVEGSAKSIRLDTAISIDTVIGVEGGVLHESYDLASTARRVLAAAAAIANREKELDGLLAQLREALRNGRISELQLSLASVRNSPSARQHPELADAFLKVQCTCSGPPGRMASCLY